MQKLPVFPQDYVYLLLPVSVLAVLFGIGYYSDASLVYWGSSQREELLLWVGGNLLLAWLLRRWFPEQALQGFVLVQALYLAFGVGLLESSSVLLFCAASWCYGQILLKLLLRDETVDHGLTRPLLIGIALQLAGFGLLIHTHFNFRWLYALLQILPLVVLWGTGLGRKSCSMLVGKLQQQSAELNAVPFRTAVLLILCAVLIARYAFIPTLSWDDNVLHLRLWTELTFTQHYSFDVSTQVLSVAPFAVDLLHAVVSLLAGADARAALNLLLFVLLSRQLWCLLTQLGLAPGAVLLTLVLFLSTPMTGFLLVGLQTEFFMALLAAAGLRIILAVQPGWYNANIVTLLAIAALLCATKLTGAVLGVLLLLAALLQWWPLRLAEWSRTPQSCKWLCVVYVAVLAVLAFNTYYTAWRITGNPVFPFYNGIFRSEFYPAENFSDTRWLQGFSVVSWWRLFFQTTDFFESRYFVAGFQYLILPLLGLPLLLQRLQLRQGLVVLLPLAGFGLIMFATTQYWRYLYPVLPLATLLIGALLLPAAVNASNANPSPGLFLKLHRFAGSFTLVTYLLLNLWFFPGISWLFAIPPGEAWTASAKEQLTYEYNPTQALTAAANELVPGSKVVYDRNNPMGATLHGTPVYLAWYSPGTLARVQGVASAADLQAWLQEAAITHVIWNMANHDTPGQGYWLMEDHLGRHGIPLAQAGTQVLYQLQSKPLLYQELYRGTDLPAAPAAQLLDTVVTGGANIARIRTTYSCETDSGSVILQLLWDRGDSWFRFLPCSMQLREYSEAILVPPGAMSAGIFNSVQQNNHASLDSLTVEIN